MSICIFNINENILPRHFENILDFKKFPRAAKNDQSNGIKLERILSKVPMKREIVHNS